MLTLAVAQIECVAGDVAANLDLHMRMISQARAQNVDLLLFPELSLTDYLTAPDCAALALTTQSAPVRMLAQAAQGIAISFGFIQRDGAVFRNAQALARDGEIVGVHRKLNIPTYGNLHEGRYYAAADALSAAVDVAGVRTTTLICADLWNPALPWLAALDGADLFLAPVASALDAVGDGFDNPSDWETTLRHTALLYGAPIVFANHCGSRGGLRFWGGSRILDAFGRDLARAGDREALICARFDPAQITHARNLLPTMRDANATLIARELRRLAS